MTEKVLEKPKKKSNRKKTKLNTYKAYKTELKLNNKEKSLQVLYRKHISSQLKCST